MSVTVVFSGSGCTSNCCLYFKRSKHFFLQKKVQPRGQSHTLVLSPNVRRREGWVRYFHISIQRRVRLCLLRGVVRVAARWRLARWRFSSRHVLVGRLLSLVLVKLRVVVGLVGHCQTIGVSCKKSK